MADQEIFRAFFSYARDDEQTDPGLVTALTTELEGRVNASLVNGRLMIWRDTERLKVGERWSEAIIGELRRAHVLIVLLTPRWIGSEYCRKEFALFEESEAARGARQCVVPVRVRPLAAEQERRLTLEQRDIYGRINRRQHFQALAVDFLTLTRARRRAEIDKLAEHIRRIIEQLSDLPQAAGSNADVDRIMPPVIHSTPAEVPLTLQTLPRSRDADRAADLAVFRDAEFAPELVVIPAGEFMMGSPEVEEERFEYEGPQHRVRIAERFAIGRYPVTFDDYDGFCEATGREKPGDESWGRRRRPIINVRWDDAQSYTAWLSQQTERVYRLPSEAEWEYACRANTTTRYSFGDVITPDNANYADSRLGRTSEVGAYSANPWGLHDMHGNVSEWVEDYWHENYRGAPSDGSAWEDTAADRNPNSRVLRGGSFTHPSKSCRSAYRSRRGVFDRQAGARRNRGFRVARTLS